MTIHADDHRVYMADPLQPAASISGANGSNLAALGVAIDEHGLKAYSALILEVAEMGAPYAPVAAAVLGDARESETARLRAFAIVSLALARELEESRTR
jgi:hypothetical protein